MTVYVDDMEAAYGNMVMCHMWADTYPELIAMAKAIGVDLKWIQHPPNASWVHFDIAKTKRTEAVRLGAVVKTTREAVVWYRTQKFEPSYAAFYPGFLEGYEAGGDGAMSSDNPYKYGERAHWCWWDGMCKAWHELGLKVPFDPDDDIPF